MTLELGQGHELYHQANISFTGKSHQAQKATYILHFRTAYGLGVKVIETGLIAYSSVEFIVIHTKFHWF